MSRSRLRRLGAVTAAAIAAGALLAGCAGAGGSQAPDAEVAGAIGVRSVEAADASPVSGGILSFASYTLPSTLDPAKTQPAGSTGGTEMAAIYDILIRHDAETHSYEPQLAKSLTTNNDGLTWTLTLRDGVTFSDGAPLDAAAVVASTQRFNQRRGANSELFTASVTSVEATDPSTVVYALNQPWSDFPALLASGHGMIVAPGADADGAFTPVGAGAFTLEAFTPQSELVLAAREGYWAGRPHLDQIKFVAIDGGQPKLDALASGGVQMAYLVKADSVEVAKGAFPGYLESFSLGKIGQVNNREGRPGADPRVRRAMALAIDPGIINTRAEDGQGLPGSEIFQSWSQWHSDVPALTADSSQARSLLEEAKADGYDGHLSYVSIQEQSAQATALAVQAMLQDVGFTVDIEYVPSATDLIKRMYVEHDFDLAAGAYSLADPAPFVRLYSSLHSASSNNVLGYRSPEMDARLQSVQAAATEDTRRDALARVQELVNEDVPFLTYGAGAAYVPWTVDVHGPVPSAGAIILLDQAWIQN